MDNDKEKRYWVHIPSRNIRQASGVEFRGKYMTEKEYAKYKERHGISERICSVRENPDHDR